MTFTDSPDWQETAVSVSAAGAMPDAPDWQKTVVGPGAVPISGGGGSPNGMPGSQQFGFLGWSAYPVIGGWSFLGLYNGNVYLSPIGFAKSGNISQGYVIYNLDDGSFNSPTMLCLYETDTPTGPGVYPDLTLVAQSTAAAFTAGTGASSTGIIDLTESVAIDSSKYYWGGMVARMNSSPILGMAASTSYPNTNNRLSLVLSTLTSGYTTLPASIAASNLTIAGGTPWTAWK